MTRYTFKRNISLHAAECVHSISCELEAIIRAAQPFENESKRRIIESVSAARNALQGLAYAYDTLLSLYFTKEVEGSDQ